ncbi:MAG TPA: preprotein translocase subunit SecY, partial [Patescibacteria group bacterium]|nr:preprotein translocase subunit SecY [Patescibacteria group bacterium]
MLEGFQNITRVPELKRRILITGLLLIVYRIGIHVHTPGIDNLALKAVFDAQAGTLFGLIDMFSGGALARFSIFTLGIMPYISSSIILQLLTVVIPQLEKLSKEGELGRRKITQYTRYGTIVLSVIQGAGIAVGLESVTAGAGSVVYHPGWAFRVMTIITLTAGTAFLMWLGEQITERGIGNGISLIIFAGIVARFPSGLVRTVTLVRTGEMNIFSGLFLLVLMVAVVAVIIYFERAHRRIPVQYARRIVGRKVYGGQSTHLPLKVNTAGVIPPIFASSILLFPATIASFIKHPITQSISNALTPGSVGYEVLFVAFIVFFCYFYTAVTFNPVDVADN